MRGLSSLVLCCLIAGCTPKQVDAVPTLSAGQPGVAAAPKRPKNVILIIGDGMGPQQIGLLELYARRAPSAPYKGRATSFQRLADRGVMGLSMHYPDRYLITDSACSATQLALGVPAPVEALGVDGNGVPQTTVLERAQAAGLSTGLVSDTRLTHATPAAFAAHVPQRSMENEVASQMLETGPDVMLSGGWRHFVAATEEGSKRTDERDLLQEARKRGYTVARTAAEMDAAGDGKLLGLFAPSGMMGAIEEHRTRGDADRTEPSLHEMAQVALQRLSTDDDGFFLMIEAGQVDWAGHGNDAGWLLHEMVRTDEMITGVLEWVLERDDTLLVVTADHETGGFGVGYSHGPMQPPPVLPGELFAESPFKPHANYGDPEILDRLYAQKESWGEVLGRHARLDENERGPAKLAAMIKDASGWTLDEVAAERILASSPHPSGHPDAPGVPEFRDFADFYPSAEYGRGGLVAREVATEQNVVWATGGHTHTPVPVFAVGPSAGDFGQMLNHTTIGILLHGYMVP